MSLGRNSDCVALRFGGAPRTVTGTEQGLSQYCLVSSADFPWSLLGNKELKLSVSESVCGEPFAHHVLRCPFMSLRVILNQEAKPMGPQTWAQVLRLGFDPIVWLNFIGSASITAGKGSVTPVGPRPL